MKVEDLVDHKRTCKYQYVVCLFGCQEKNLVRGDMTMEAHYGTCGNMPLVCKHCQETFPRSELSAHESSCPEQLQECRFHCGVSVKLKNMEVHLAENVVTHLSLADKALTAVALEKDTQIATMQKEIDSIKKQSRDQKKEYDDKIATLKKKTRSQWRVVSPNGVDFRKTMNMTDRAEIDTKTNDVVTVTEESKCGRWIKCENGFWLPVTLENGRVLVENKDMQINRLEAKVTTMDQTVSALRAQLQGIAAQLKVTVTPAVLRVSGRVGYLSKNINGVFHLQPTLHDGRPYWQRLGDDQVVYWHDSLTNWHISTENNMLTSPNKAYAASKKKDVPDPSKVTMWQAWRGVDVDDNLVDDPNIKVSVDDEKRSES